tara:strand:+ start:1888 stop:2706 length:819 start_codon:yes stop_codon:yes gene_type:complete
MQLVSVIIPTYNRSEFLVESIKSIWKQIHRPIEVLIIDDGSTDDTKTRVDNLKEKFEKENFKIIYKYQKNKGSNVARNEGLKIASGNWIQFLDSDDLLEKDKFKIQLKALLETKADIAICNFKILMSCRKILLINNDGNMLRRLSFGHSIMIATPLFRKKLLENIHWNEKLYREQDKEFIYKAFLKSKKYIYVNACLSTYRKHDKPKISNNYSKTPLQTFENIKSDLSIIFSTDYKLNGYKIFLILIHIIYLINKLLKRNLKYLLFRKYSLK